jgi:hypothetical protein
MWFGFVGCASSESVSRLELRMVEYESKFESLTEEVGMLKSNNDLLSDQLHDLKGLIYNPSTQPNQSKENIVTDTLKAKKKTIEKTQCKAITKSGTQCKRSTQPGSDFCWQHSGNKTPTVNKEKSTVTPPSSDRTIQTGPRGGQYYLNSSGKKVYVKKKK